MRRFDGRVAIVTGAASGIGRATAERLTHEGAVVVGIDIQGETDLTGDVRDPDLADAAVACALDLHGRLDVVCNVAGILRTGNSHEATVDDWYLLLGVNLVGTFLFCKAAIPTFVAQGHGSIVNTSSTAALAGHPWAAAYSASKGGVLALTRTLAVEYGRQGVRVNCVCPGSIDTQITGDFVLPDGADPKLLRRIMALDKPRGPETVAAAIAYLASDDAAHVNGESLRVDGATLA